MTRSDVQRIVDEVLAQVLDVPLTTAAAVTRSGVDSWTSLAHIEIIFSIEDELRIRLSDDEAAFADSRDDLVALAAARLGL